MATAKLQADIIADVMRIRSEIGRIPNRVEYQRHGKFPGTAIIDAFGSYAFMLRASGLEYTKGKRDRAELRKQAFEHTVKEIEEKKRHAEPPPLARNLLILPDLHAPAMHKRAPDFVAAVVKKYGYDIACCTGDEIDGHAWSFHDANPDALNPGAELEAAIKQLQPFYKLFPNLRLASSNHGDLVFRKQRHHGLPAKVIKPYGEVIDAPKGWTWDFEIKLQMSNGKRLLIHHSYSANALRASQQRGINYVAGHHHSQFSIQYWRNYDDLYFAAFAGCLVDELSLAMLYGRNVMHRPILGLIRIEDGVPYLVPMLLDGAGAWTGKIP